MLEVSKDTPIGKCGGVSWAQVEEMNAQAFLRTLKDMGTMVTSTGRITSSEPQFGELPRDLSAYSYAVNPYAEQQRSMEVERPRRETGFECGYSAAGGGVATMQHHLKWLRAHLPRILELTKAEAIVVQGSSGLAVAFGMLGAGVEPPVPLVMVRKPSERSHGPTIQLLSNPGRSSFSTYLFLDDLVASGGTLSRVQEQVSAKCVGVVLYAQQWHGERLQIDTRGSDIPQFSRKVDEYY